MLTRHPGCRTPDTVVRARALTCIACLFAGDAVAAGKQEVQNGGVHGAHKLLLKLLVLLLHLPSRIRAAWRAERLSDTAFLSSAGG